MADFIQDLAIVYLMTYNILISINNIKQNRKP